MISQTLHIKPGVATSMLELDKLVTRQMDRLMLMPFSLFLSKGKMQSHLDVEIDYEDREVAIRTLQMLLALMMLSIMQSIFSKLVNKENVEANRVAQKVTLTMSQRRIR